MSGHVLLNLLNEVEKRDKMRGLLLGFAFTESDDIGFLNTAGSLQQEKCFMVMEFLLWVYTVSKTCVYTVAWFTKPDTHRKRAGVYAISRPIFWNSYIIIQVCLFGFSVLEGEFLGLGLWYIIKESQYFLLKRQNDEKTGRVSASFLLSENHSQFSLSNSNLTDQTAQRE